MIVSDQIWPNEAITATHAILNDESVLSKVRYTKGKEQESMQYILHDKHNFHLGDTIYGSIIFMISLSNIRTIRIIIMIFEES